MCSVLCFPFSNPNTLQAPNSTTLPYFVVKETKNGVSNSKKSYKKKDVRPLAAVLCYFKQ